MGNISFISPDGSLNREPELDDMIELMHSRGEDFWNSNCDTGFATLEYSQQKARIAQLVFTKKDTFGFHMLFDEYPDQREKWRSYLSVGSDNYEDVAEVNLCDSPILLPRAYFIDDSQAEEVVRAFFHGGKRTESDFWKPTAELKWDLQEGRLVE